MYSADYMMKIEWYITFSNHEKIIGTEYLIFLILWFQV